MQYTLITITDSISPANMPYNEFILYRLLHEPSVKQAFIVLFDSENRSDIKYPKELIVYLCGKRIALLKGAIQEIESICKRENTIPIFHIHEGKSALLFDAVSKGKYRKQIVYTIHSTFSKYPLHNKFLSVFASCIAAKVVCVSETAFRHYPVLLNKLLKEKVVSIQNGVDCERVDRVLNDFPQKMISTELQRIRLIYVARLIPLKQHHVLIKALREIPNCELTLIGHGKLRKELQVLTEECGVADRVVFLGFLPRDEVYVQIKNHDVYVSSSSYEGLPISVLEAMSCGVVCAVSDIEQHREIQEKCPSLITVNNTPEDWVKAIRSIAAMTSRERAQIAAQNKRDVDRFFSLERMHEQYDRVYEEIAGGSPS